MSEWIKCSDRTPPESQPVWLWDGNRLWIGAYEYCNDDPGGWFYGMGYGERWNSFYARWELMDNDWDDDYQPTHWMPLPEPPVETTDQGAERSEGDEPEARA